MASHTYTCTGCVPIDAKIIDVYTQMLGTEARAEQATADAEAAAQHAIGKSPYIGENGDWFEWDDAEARFIDTGVQAQGSIAVDTEMSLSSTNPVQNKVVTGAVNAKQDTLVSGTNIKTVNGESLLGSGNIVAGDPNAVKYTEQSLTDGQKTQARTNIGAGTYTKAGTGIPKTDLASDVQTSLGKADTAIQDISGKQDVIPDLSTIRSGAAAGATAYQKPGIGIPSSDMASAVQTSLGKADTAYQKPSGGIPASDLASGVIPDVSGFYTKPASGIPASDIASGVIPTVPTISTDVSADAASDVKTSSPKSVKTYVDAGIAAVGSDLSDLEDVVGAIDIGAYVMAWDGNSEPVVANIPAGVSVTYNTTTYTGTLAAGASTIQKIYLVATGTTDNYDRYITVGDSTYSWVNLGTTEITLADYATKAEVSQLEAKLNNLANTRYYGIFTSSADLPADASENGYAYVGSSTPLAIYEFDGEDWNDTGVTVNSIQGEPGVDGVGFASVASPSPADGTVTITLSNGDTMTLDLNHNHPAYYSKVAETSNPSGGFLPDVVYSLGTLTGTVTFALAAAVSGNLNHYFWMFSTGGTAPTVTWPSTGITWAAGSAPTVAANKKYEISILGGVAYYSEV